MIRYYVALRNNYYGLNKIHHYYLSLHFSGASSSPSEWEEKAGGGNEVAAEAGRDQREWTADDTWSEDRVNENVGGSDSRDCVRERCGGQSVDGVLDAVV